MSIDVSAWNLTAIKIKRFFLYAIIHICIFNITSPLCRLNKISFLSEYRTIYNNHIVIIVVCSWMLLIYAIRPIPFAIFHQISKRFFPIAKRTKFCAQIYSSLIFFSFYRNFVILFLLHSRKISFGWFCFDAFFSAKDWKNNEREITVNDFHSNWQSLTARCVFRQTYTRTIVRSYVTY